MLPRRAPTFLVATLVTALSVLAAGCDDGPSAAGSTPDAGATSSAPTTAPTTTGAPEPDGSSSYPTYVALGDSYTAAPGVPQTDLTTPCARSDGNYPSLLAAALGSDLVDVSCSGASTLSLVGAQRSGNEVLPAQFEALGPDTSLVTLGIGGNDEELFQTLVGTCTQLGSGQPQGSPCQDRAAAGGRKQDPLLEKVATIGARVTAAVKGVHDRAPEATVVLVGYPQPVPASGTCAALPLARGDYAYVRSVTEALNQALRAAADAGGATFVDVAAASEGHDICAGADAWVNGTRSDLNRAVAFHPFAEEQQAVADLVLAQLGQP